MKLTGKVSLISACGRGIGKEIALTLARAGSDVVINSFSEENTQALANEIEALGVKVVAVAGDVTTSVVILEMVAAAIEAFGKIDIVVNNVGGGSASDIDDKDNPLAEVEAIWDGTYAMSLKAPVLMCEAVMPHLIEQNSGKIINISSLAGRSGMPHVDLVPLSASYHSAKAGLIRYSQVLADQVGRHNINVNAICPGIIYTDGWREISEEMVKNHPRFKGEDPREWFVGIGEGKYVGEGLPQTAMRREQTTGDIAEAVLFLASEAAANITGQTLNVDGGMAKD
ncbi:MAG: SDR family NAD(P)-dependent oxidoreductase [Pseudomonadales bacterium]|nr:SDR family NAD(P)-dependent oxidoreductase [Pseudomonadales bacterium]